MPKALIKHFGRVMNGRLNFHNKEYWYQQAWALEGKEFELQIKERKQKVTNDQYAYYYGAILPTCIETEHFSHFDKPADIHIYFEYKFLTYKVMLEAGDVKKEISKTYSLSDLGKKEMSMFIEKVIMHLRADLHINILSSEEYYNEQYSTIKK